MKMATARRPLVEVAGYECGHCACFRVAHVGVVERPLEPEPAARICARTRTCYLCHWLGLGPQLRALWLEQLVHHKESP